MRALTTGPAAAGVLTAAGPVLDSASLWARDRATQLRAIADVPVDADIPLYGSEEWAALAPNDGLRWLSALRAAEAWLIDQDPHVLAARLDAELEAQRRADERDYDGWRQLARRVRADAGAPDHDELLRRRARTVRPAGYWPTPWPSGSLT